MSAVDSYIAAECRAANAIAARLRGGSAFVAKVRKEKQAKVQKQIRVWPVTAAQQRVFDYMREFLAANDELPPLWAISQHFGWSTCSSAQTHIDALAKKGLIERNEIGNWRIARGAA